MVSAAGTPYHQLARYLHEILLPTILHPESYIQDSRHYVQILRQLTITEDDILVSLKWNHFSPTFRYSTHWSSSGSNLPQDVASLAEYCISPTICVYNGKFCGQVKGPAIGSSLSHLIAKIFMIAFEEEKIECSPIKPKCWHRYIYMDDLFAI
jgi:hypothetical protein